VELEDVEDVEDVDPLVDAPLPDDDPLPEAAGIDEVTDSERLEGLPFRALPARASVR
jgi:hypothetical protein